MREIIFVITWLIASLGCNAQQNVNSILRNLEKPASNNVLVVSHRADWRNAPENSLQAIQNCIDMGVDMVEIDLNKTKDGQLIVMHDRTLNRTTNGKGLASDYTLDEIKRMTLKNGAGCKTRHKVPTFEEVMLLCKGKIMVNIDKGYEYFKEAYAILEKTATVNQCVIKSSHPYGKVVKENGDVLRKVMFMPVVNIDKEEAEQIIDDYIINLRPIAFELVFKDCSPEVLRLIKKVRDSGAKIWINTLWPELCGGHDDDRAVELKEPEESWGWVINQGAKLIQTDRPALLLDYLRDKKLHK